MGTVARLLASTIIEQCKQHHMQNYMLVLLDAHVDQTNGDCQNILAQLRNIFNDVTICTDLTQYIQYLNDIKDGKAFVIISGALGQHLVPNIYIMPVRCNLHILQQQRVT
ncbi:unnamed protein product [Rotaria socialis]|uniref:Uncharacterized protein n=1 Tax=Rotaria socialis TaxID=392032 RepID=A0A821CAY3_9BILA|nr:unnamed protein product [Rotaria socialis]CAF4604254.1 unnamed protein product [Rotaria socialis]